MASVLGWQNISSIALRVDRRTEVIDAVKAKYPDAVEKKEGPVFAYWVGDNNLVGISWLLHSRWTFVLSPTVGKRLFIVPIDANKVRIADTAPLARPSPPPQTDQVDWQQIIAQRHARHERQKSLRTQAAYVKRVRVIEQEKIRFRLRERRKQIRDELFEITLQLQDIDSTLKELDDLEARHKKRLALSDDWSKVFKQWSALNKRLRTVDAELVPIKAYFAVHEKATFQARQKEIRNLRDFIIEGREVLGDLTERLEESIVPYHVEVQRQRRMRLSARSYAGCTADDIDMLMDTDWDTPHVRADDHYASIQRTNGDGCRQVEYKDLDIGDHETHIEYYE